MAFRTVAYLKSTVNNLRGGSSSFATSTAGHSLPSSGGIKSKWLPKGDFIPVYVAAGMIALSAGFGMFTMWHQLGRAPNVSVKKSRRESIPEVVEPERAADCGERFVKQSFFRKIAHVQDFDRQVVMDDPIRGDVFNRPVRVETLKDAGVDPMAH